MGKIKVLDKLIANMIAAGEVVERPSSAVKELFENALDAFASHITIEIKDGGKELIKITDDGIGMDAEDARLSIVPHATSKISTADDLFDIKTMGFRGEALASIASVSEMKIVTRKEDSDTGTLIFVKGGETVKEEETGCPKGTTITIENLFFNTPARLKFLKKSQTESACIEEMIGKLILANPSVSVKFVKDGREIFHSKGDNDLKNAIYCVYGSSITDNLVYVDKERNGITVNGYVGNPNIARPTAKLENFCVNSRICRTKTMTSALEFAYFQKMAQGKHPFCALNITIDYKLCDVNIHPQKAQVKFSDDNAVYDAILDAVRNALDSELFVKKAETIQEKKIYPQFKEEKSFQETFEKKEVSEIKEKKEEPLPFHKAADFSFMKDSSKDTYLTPTPIKKEEPITEKQEPQIKKEPEAPAMIAVCEEEKAESYKIIGQIFSTYIIIEKDNEMILMDQHAAHERMNYEMLRESYKQRKSNAQYIMIPKKVELSATEYDIVMNNLDIFSNLGMEIEAFGDKTVIVRSIPLDVKERHIERLVYEITDEISKHGTMKKEDFNQRLLYLVACKMSIKANMTLTQKDMEDLVKRAFSLNGKTTCPHGRPLFVSFDKAFIETKFQR